MKTIRYVAILTVLATVCLMVISSHHFFHYPNASTVEVSTVTSAQGESMPSVTITAHRPQMTAAKLRSLNVANPAPKTPLQNQS